MLDRQEGEPDPLPVRQRDVNPRAFTERIEDAGIFAAGQRHIALHVHVAQGQPPAEAERAAEFLLQ